jgi:hypothetical protein
MGQGRRFPRPGDGGERTAHRTPWIRRIRCEVPSAPSLDIAQLQALQTFVRGPERMEEPTAKPSHVNGATTLQIGGFQH